MKFNSLIYKSIFLVIISAVSFGCLKDDAFDNKEIQSIHGSGQQNVVAIALTATTTSNHLQLAFNKSDVDTTFDAIPVTLAGKPANEDIQVTLLINPALLGSYNANNGTLHEEAPTSVYSITNSGDSATGYLVTIPKGSNTGYLQLKIKPNDFLGVDYALGVEISNISPSGYLIASNLSTGILAIATKNLWDGIYTLTQKTVGWAAYGIADGETYTWPSDVALITASAVADDIHTAEAGFGQPAFVTGGGITSFGATATRYVFDPVTNALVDVINTVPDDGRGRTFFLNPAVPDSRYDPVTKTIYASYQMTQNGRPNQYFYDTLTYIGPR
jgi:hypothetical protein